MARIKFNWQPTVVMMLAIVFLAYHVFATILGLISFAQIVFDGEVEAQVESTAINPLESTVTEVQLAEEIEYGTDTAQELWPKRLVATPINLNINIGNIESSNQFATHSITSAVFVRSSATPNGRAGNTVLLADDNEGPFQRLHDLLVGDEILVKLPTVGYTYTVVGFKLTPGSSLQSIAQTNHPSLTLVALNPSSSVGHFTVVANYSRTIHPTNLVDW